VVETGSPIALAASTEQNLFEIKVHYTDYVPVNAEARSIQNPLDAVKAVRSSPIVFITRRPIQIKPSDIPKPPNARIIVGVYPVCET